MKKISFVPQSFDPRRVITLDESQLTIYKKGYLDILSPNGELLTTISEALSHRAESFEREMAIDNLYLLEDLIRNTTDGLELSSRGAHGLANAFWLAKEITKNN